MNKLLFILFARLMFSCGDDDVVEVVEETTFPGELSIEMNSSFGESPFTLDTEYTTTEGDQIRPSELRYWISNISLKKSDGTSYEIPDSYFLIQNCKAQQIQEGQFIMPAVKREFVNIQGIPAGTYKSITFSIGVDSEYNDNLSLQAGELSVMQNMTNSAWMWHTSYIFAKVGGTYRTESGDDVNFSFETGTNELYKTITKSFSTPLTINGLKNGEIVLSADASKLFKGIKVTDASLWGGATAVYKITPSTPELMAKLADNYTTIFALESAQNVQP